MNTTLNKILKHNPCGQQEGSEKGWEKLLKYLGKTKADDEPLPIRTILESNGVEDAIWALRAVEGYDKEIRLFAADCAESVLHFFEEKYPNDDRPRKVIQAARDFANGLISENELRAAAAAAAAYWAAAANTAYWAADWAAAADAAYWAAAAAYWAAVTAADGAVAAAAAYWTAITAADAAYWTAITAAAADAAAKYREREKQKQFLLKYI